MNTQESKENGLIWEFPIEIKHLYSRKLTLKWSKLSNVMIRPNSASFAYTEILKTKQQPITKTIINERSMIALRIFTLHSANVNCNLRHDSTFHRPNPDNSWIVSRKVLFKLNILPFAFSAVPELFFRFQRIFAHREIFAETTDFCCVSVLWVYSLFQSPKYMLLNFVIRHRCWSFNGTIQICPLKTAFIRFFDRPI